MGSRNRTKLTYWLTLIYLTATLLVAGTDILFLSELKQYYTNTEQIIFCMANDMEHREDVLKLLKEPPENAWLNSGTEHMAAYGYNTETQTIWDQRYHSARQNILLFFTGFEAILLLLFVGLFFLLKKYDTQQAAELEKILCRIQDTNSSRISSLPPNGIEVSNRISSSLPNGIEVSSRISSLPPNGIEVSNRISSSLPNGMCAPEDIRIPSQIDTEELDDILKDRLRSLQEQIQSDRSRILLEKEATKALVTDISHQLKTPVAALKTNLELLATEELSPDERQEFLTACLCQTDSLENLTRALVNVSRLEKGLIQITPEHSEINSTLRSAVSRIYEKALEKQISIEMEEADELSALHDRTWTAEVFLNILDNAIKYSPEQTHITIRLTSLIHFIKIDIEDEGIGIPKSEYHKIFQRFYRGKSVQDIEGSGIGLYLARSIIEKQNGSIYVHTKKPPQTGSVFSIQLPKT